MKSALLSFVVGVSILPCSAQLAEEFTTPAGEYSGYYWRSLSVDEKLAFVMGYQAGYLSARPSNDTAIAEDRKACLARLTNPTTEQKVNCITKSLEARTEAYKEWEGLDALAGGTYTYGDTIQATDRFFGEPENRVMPISAAWLMTKWKQEGREQSALDGLMDSFRETYIRGPRRLCESGVFITASRCRILGTTLKPTQKAQ